MAQTDTVLRIRIDADPFIRSMHDAAESFRGMAFWAQGLPKPPRKPYRRNVSGMTAREYRAARRAYRRALTAWRRSL